MEMVETKKIMALLLEMGNVGDKIGRDGNYGHLSMLFDEGMGLSSVKWAMLTEELKEGDKKDLEEMIKVKLEIKDEELEEFIESALSWILQSIAFMMMTLKYFKKEEK